MKHHSQRPSWFNMVSILVLLWSIMGVVQYLGSAYKMEFITSGLSEEQLEYMNQLPTWVMAAFAIGTWFGLLGAFSLVFKKKWALSFFRISFLGIAVNLLHTITSEKAMELFGSASDITLNLLILVIGFAMIILSKKAVRNGWIH